MGFHPKSHEEPSKFFQWRCGNLLRLYSEKVILITKQSACRRQGDQGEAAAMSAGRRCGVDSGGGGEVKLGDLGPMGRTEGSIRPS